MSRYVIHARRFAGSLAEPVRNDTDNAGSDDYREAVRLAEDLSRRGWAAWVYEDQRGPDPEPGYYPGPEPPGGRYRLRAEWRANGVRVQ